MMMGGVVLKTSTEVGPPPTTTKCSKRLFSSSFVYGLCEEIFFFGNRDVTDEKKIWGEKLLRRCFFQTFNQFLSY